MYSFAVSGNGEKCPYCKAERMGRTDEEAVEDTMKRVEANDAAAMYALGIDYRNGLRGLQQDEKRALELYARAAELGSRRRISALVSIIMRGEI